jgi:AraC-like DNA-binding protein
VEVPRGPTSALLMTRLGAERGLRAETCLRGTGLRIADLRDPSTTIAVEQELRVVGNVLDALGDPPGFGLDVGVRFHLTSYGIWGFALISSRTPREAVAVGLRYLDLTYALCRMSQSEEPGGLRLLIDPSSVPAPLRRFMVERDTAAIHTIQREMYGTERQLAEVTYAFPAPAADGVLDRYREVFGFTPRFGAAASTVLFEPERLDQPLPQADEHSAALAEAQCRDLLDARRARAGLSGRVRDQLLTRPQEPLDADTVAAALHLSPRSLRRRLAEEGTSYRLLLDEVRERLAEELLLTSGLAVEQVAQRLGYAETSSFIHAFRRWKGITPHAYRRSGAGR